MTNRPLRAAVMCAALMTAPALAQTQAPTAPAPAAPTAPAPTAPAPAARPMAAPSTSAATTVMTEQKAGQWLASKLPGVDVYNAGDEKIGDIADLVIDKEGKVHAAIISVGGFLGLGKHDVAVPLSEIKWVETAPAAPRAATPANPTATTPPRNEPATTGTVTTAPAAGAAADAPRAYPYRAVINMTAEQLKAAPAFKYAN